MNDMNRKILIVTPYYYPDIASSVKLMKELAEFLSDYFDVVVYTNEIRKKDSYFRGSKQEENRIRLVRVRNCFVRLPGLLAKVFEYIVFSIKLVIYIRNRRNLFNTIFCQSNPPLLTIPIRIAAGKQAKVIFNVQDLFPNSLVPYFGSHNYYFLRKCEKIAYNWSDIVTTISQDFAKWIRSISNTTVKIIPNWINTAEISFVEQQHNNVYSSIDSIIKQKPIIVYSGNIGINQDFDTVLEVSKMSEDLNFVIIGSGKKKKDLKIKITKCGINNIFLLEPFPSEKIPEVYSFADIYLLPMRKNAMIASYPSKAWSILACGSTLVASLDVNSGFAREMTTNQLAYVCEPENATELLRVIRIALEENSNNARVRQYRMEYVRKNYDIMIAMQNYLDLMQQIADYN